jgi:hypothetical protein
VLFRVIVFGLFAPTAILPKLSLGGLIAN